MALKLKTGLAVVGISVLAMVAIELFARAGLFIGDNVLNLGLTEAKAQQPAFAHVDYDPELLIREEERTEVGYQPYTVWRTRPFQGTLVNVDEKGDRVTLFNSSQDHALKVWMLGGSTMFGIGSPDDQTIPSHLAKLLNETWGVDVQVRNLGQGAYVSTQEVINLLRELQLGQQPDVVVFYDGFNDSISAKKFPEVPGAHFQFVQIRDRFETVLTPLARSSGVFQSVEWILVRRLGVDFTPSEGADIRQLGQQAARTWLENARIVSAVGESYGFIPLFLIQPAQKLEGMPRIDSRKAVSRVAANGPFEGATQNVMSERRNAILNHIEEQSDLNIYDISDVFRDIAQPVYIDQVHVTSKGNEMISRRIFELLVNELCHNTPPNASEVARAQLAAACK